MPFVVAVKTKGWPKNMSSAHVSIYISSDLALLPDFFASSCHELKNIFIIITAIVWYFSYCKINDPQIHSAELQNLSLIHI